MSGKFKAKDVSEHELTLVGQILIDPSCYEEAGLDPEHFFNPSLQYVMKAIKKLRDAGESVDELLVCDAISDDRLRAMGGLAFISGLALRVSTTDNAVYYANSIRDAWLQRQCAAIHGDIATMSHQGCSGEELVAAIRGKVDLLEGLSSHRPPTMAEAYLQEYKEIEADRIAIANGERVLVGLPTGLGLDDVVPGGLPIDKLTTLFAESGNYKTTTKNNMIWGIASTGLGSVLDVSLEDANKLTVQRFIARQTGLSYGNVATRKLSEDDTELIGSVADEALETASRIILGGDLPPNIDDIIRLARHYKRTRGLVAVFIDYLQLLDEDDDSERIALKKILKKAQRAAKRDRIAYVFISQVGQEVDSRAKDGKQSSRPSINDMFGSSWMKFASKLSIGLYRPYKYEKVPRKSKRKHEPDYTRLWNEHPKGKEIYPMVLEMWLQKNILGEPEVCVPCLVQPATGRMREMPWEIKQYLM